MGQGNKRGKQDDGREAGGRMPGAKDGHEDDVTYQPESGAPVPDEKQAPAQRDRTPSDDI